MFPSQPAFSPFFSPLHASKYWSFSALPVFCSLTLKQLGHLLRNWGHLEGSGSVSPFLPCVSFLPVGASRRFPSIRGPRKTHPSISWSYPHLELLSPAFNFSVTGAFLLANKRALPLPSFSGLEGLLVHTFHLKNAFMTVKSSLTSTTSICSPPPEVSTVIHSGFSLPDTSVHPCKCVSNKVLVITYLHKS